MAYLRAHAAAGLPTSDVSAAADIPGDAFAKLEREAIDAFEQRGGDAFTRLEREVLRPKEVHHESQLMQLKDRVQQLHLEARAHVLLESDAQNSLAEIKGKVRELQLAFRSLSELVVEEIDGMRAEQRKQRDDIDALWRSHREMATLKIQVAGLLRTDAVRADADAAIQRLRDREASRDREHSQVRRELDEVRAQAARDRDALESLMRVVHSGRRFGD